MSRQKYLRNHELRQEIAYAVGADPSRYEKEKDEPGYQKVPNLRKADIVRAADTLQPDGAECEPAAMQLGELYECVCEWAGGEYQSNAGRPWGVNRENLKLIHQAVDGRPPDEAVEVRADGGTEADTHYVSCVDCEREIAYRKATTVTCLDHHDDGGYTEFQAPACHRCALERRGHECEHCGQLHETARQAYECCIGDSKAPDCPECGRRMEVGAAGYDPVGGQEITWAECECCPVGWGRYTGWELLDGEEPCKHVDGGEFDAE